VAASLHTEYGIIVRGLAQAARNAHRNAAGKTRLHHAVSFRTAVADASQNSLLTRLLGHAAA